MAALDALRYINGRSIATNHEYMGYIVVSGRQFVATIPVQITETGGNATGDLPKGAVGDYHTHGNYSMQTGPDTIMVTGDPSKDNLNSDSFSASDVERYQTLESKLGQYRGYLGTPGNNYYIFYKGAKGDLVQIVEQQERAQQQREQEQQVLK